MAQQHVARSTSPAPDTTRLTANLKRLTWLFVEQYITEEEYQRDTRQIRQQLAEVHPGIQRVLDVEKAAAVLDDMAMLLTAATRAEHRALIHQIIKTAWITKEGIYALRPTPTFRLLVDVAAREHVDCMTPTGLDGTSSAFSHTRIPELWDALNVKMHYESL